MEDIKIWLQSEWERVAAGVAVALGGIALFLGYQGVSGSPYVAEQLSYLVSGGVGGLFLLGVGATLFLSADLHDEWRKLDELEAAIREHRGNGIGGSAGDGARSNGKVTYVDTDLDIDVDVVAVAAAALASGPAPRPAVERSRWNAVTPAPVRLLQVRSAVVALVLAAVFAVVWLDVGGQADAGDALGGVARSVAVLFAVGLALAGYLALLRRGVAQRSVVVVGGLAAAAQATTLVVPRRDEPIDRAGDGAVLVGRGLNRYHTPGCPMVASISRPRRLPLSKAAATAAPCGLCDAAGAASDRAAGVP